MQRIASTSNNPASPVEEKAPVDNDAVPRRFFVTAGSMLGFFLVFGVFNRITFPAFLLIPGMQLLPHLLNKPLALTALLVSSLFWLFVAIATDTAFYIGPAATTSFRALFDYVRTVPVITPVNNLLYNTKASNLKQHGLHPHYQHLLINLPQLLGPALLLLAHYPLQWSNVDLDRMLRNPRLTAAVTGAVILSVIPHQEARFLLPCIPLLLTCVRLPDNKTWRKRFWVTWAIFNGFMGILMGIYHQGGIIPIQLSMRSTVQRSITSTIPDGTNKQVQAQVYWWKTYPPSLYMTAPLPSDGHRVEHTLHTNVLLGVNRTTLLGRLTEHLPPCDNQRTIFQKVTSNVFSSDNAEHVFLVAPFAALRFPELEATPPPISNYSFSIYTDQHHDSEEQARNRLELTHLETYRRHINLDDMDFADDGIWPTLSRIIGRRGLGVWRVERSCSASINTDVRYA